MSEPYIIKSEDFDSDKHELQKLNAEGTECIGWGSRLEGRIVPANSLIVVRDKPKSDSLRDKLEIYHEGRNRPVTDPDVAIAVFREHFDSKREEMDQAVTDWMSDPDAEDNWLDRLRSILLGDES